MPAQGIDWVIQKGIITATDHERLTDAIRHTGGSLHELQLIPFIHEASGAVPEISGPCLVYGSSGLLAFAKRQGWRPAGWDGQCFDATAIIAGLRGLALNAAACAVPLADAVHVAQVRGWTRVFIRPDSETKAFAGQVLTPAGLESWIAMRISGDAECARDMRIIIAPALDIIREWRLFVIAGGIVTASQYARDGHREDAPGAPEEVLRFAEVSLGLYAPAPAFVLDVAEVRTPEGNKLRAIEYNSVNSSGFYACDVRAIITALTDLVLSDNGRDRI